MIIRQKLLWLSLLAAVLMTFLFPSGLLLAQVDKIDLTLRLLPDYYYREIIPGEDNTLYMEVRNNGNKEITNIRFDSDKPEGWVVNFSPASISSLGAGSSQRVDVNVIPDRDARKREYNLTFLADANETRAATSTVLRIEDSFSVWWWIGGGIAVLVIAGFVFIFLRFGR